MYIILLVVILGFLSPLTATARTFYTSTSGNDANGCGTSPTTGAQNINTPMRNINATLNCLSSGDTLYVRGGTYNENIHTPLNTHIPSGGGSWATATVISSYQNEQVNVKRFGFQDGFDSVPPSWIIVNGFRMNPIVGTGPFFTECSQGVWIGGTSHHIRVINSDITGCTAVQLVSTTADLEIINNDIHDSPVSKDPAYADTVGGYGFYANSLRMLIDGNRIYNNSGFAIHLYASGYSGSNDNVIRNNFIYGNCYDDGTRAQALTAVIIGAGSNTKFYNNVVFNNVNCVGGGAAVLLAYNNGGTNTQVYNNTIYGNSYAGISIDPTAPGSVITNNVVFGNGTPIQNDAGVSTTLQTNLTTDPHFVDTNNILGGGLKVRADSAARNAGTAIPTLTFDKDGAARPQGQIDIGAYEYNEGITPPTPTGNPIYVRKVGGSPSNNCTVAENAGTAKQTIADACQCMTTPGKVMYVEGNGNTYTEEIDTLACPLTGGNGPSYTDATRIEGYGTTPPIIQSPVATSGMTLFVHNANDKYLIFKNLIFDAASRAGNALIVYGPAHHVRFDTVTFKNSLFENALIYAANNIEMVDTTSTTAASNGLGLAGAIDTFLCMRCHFISNGAKGVDIRNGGAKTNISFMRSEIVSNATYGIDGLGATNTVVQNSIIRSNNGNGIRIQSTMASTKLFNNTVYGNTGNGVQCDSGATGTQMTNVISYGNGTNLVNNCTMTQLTNLTGTLDPLFVSSPLDLRLANGSIGIDQGTNLPALTTDYAGLPRQQGQQDIGAHERAEGTPPVPPGPGVLSVSTINPRYFVNPAGDIVYLTGAYSWNFADTMPDQEFADYLAYVVTHGYNLLRVPSQDYNGEAQSTSYFNVLATRVGQAASAGLYVQLSILPFTDAPFDSQVFNEAYARDLVQAVGAYPNVIYEVGNELDTQALDGGTLGSFVTSMVSAINNEQSVQGFTPRRMVGISDFRANGAYSANASTVSFMLGSGADFISLGFSQRTFFPCWIPPDYAGVKVSIPDTDHISPYQCDHKWVWKVFAMGHNPTVLDGNAFTPDFSVPDDPGDTFGAAATYDARSRMGDTRTYALKMRLDMAIPHPELSTTGYALVWPGNQYLVYQPGTGSFNVTVGTGDYTVEWFNPTDHTTTTTTFTAVSSGAYSFTTPLNPAHDAVLLLKVGTPIPPAPNVTVLTPSKRGRSMMFDLATQVCWHDFCNILP